MPIYVGIATAVATPIVTPDLADAFRQVELKGELITVRRGDRERGVVAVLVLMTDSDNATADQQAIAEAYSSQVDVDWEQGALIRDTGGRLAAAGYQTQAW
jgi:hypothetical protein